ncbi:hypothetical protein [Leisingera sp.]|uniref:hypothetical protein n=1 Tax=Leisingera sp. TaxID=1879318 RepID=UPI002B26E1E1|nr:hypothetical protein [Leisingera sp.]
MRHETRRLATVTLLKSAAEAEWPGSSPLATISAAGKSTDRQVKGGYRRETAGAKFENQKAEAGIGAKVLNRMTGLGRSRFELIA